MPGVLILEGMAQLSGLLLEVSLKVLFDKNAKAVLTVLERSKFRQMVRPGEVLTYRTRMTNPNELGGKVSVERIGTSSLSPVRAWCSASSRSTIPNWTRRCA